MKYAPAPRGYGQRLELAEGTSPRGLKCHCKDNPVIFSLPRCTSPELLFSYCGSVAALPALKDCDGQVAKTIISRPRQPTHSALCMAPTARDFEVAKQLHSPVRDARARNRHFLFPVPNYSTEFLTLSSPLHPFSSASSRLQGNFFARDCAHVGMPVRQPNGHQVFGGGM